MDIKKFMENGQVVITKAAGQMNAVITVINGTNTRCSIVQIADAPIKETSVEIVIIVDNSIKSHVVHKGNNTSDITLPNVMRLDAELTAILNLLN